MLVSVCACVRIYVCVFVIAAHATAVPMGTCLSCLDMWKVRIPSSVKNEDLTGKLVLVKKISGRMHYSCSRHSIDVSPPTVPLALDAKPHIPCLKAEIGTLSRVPPHPLILNLIGICNSGGLFMHKRHRHTHTQAHTHTHTDGSLFHRCSTGDNAGVPTPRKAPLISSGEEEVYGVWQHPALARLGSEEQ